MFWLLSLLMPNHRREGGQTRFENISVLLQSPENRGLLLKILGIIAGIALAWVIFVGILSLLNAWLVIAVAVVTTGFVGHREWKNHRRENWIAQGCCAQCGYDLRATPMQCPECGRDATLDEPTWRRMRRELEAKLLENAEAQTETQTPVEPATLEPPIPVVLHRPPTDDAPIPLE